MDRVRRRMKTRVYTDAELRNSYNPDSLNYVVPRSPKEQRRLRELFIDDFLQVVQTPSSDKIESMKESARCLMIRCNIYVNDIFLNF